MSIEKFFLVIVLNEVDKIPARRVLVIVRGQLKKLGKLFCLFCAGLFSAICMVVSAAYLYLAPLLPAAETYRNVRLETPLRIYTADNRLIDEIGNRRNPVLFEDIPPVLVNALIATEDVRFYSHPGVDVQSLIRGARI